MNRDIRGERGYFGKELEEDIFGHVKATKEFQEFYKKIVKKNGYVEYGPAIRLVREFTEQDPTNPEKEFLNDLRLEIADQLELEEDEIGGLLAFSAVGTPIDRWHGVDAFIELDIGDDRRGPIVITLDATLNSKKDEYKADVIIGDIPAPEENGYLNVVELYASKIIANMKEKIELAA